MATPDVPSPEARDPTTPIPREDEPLWALTVGDAQEVALDQLGRFLTEAEIRAVVKMVLASLNVTPLLREAIEVCQEYGTVGPAAEEPAAAAPLHPADEGALPEPIPGDAVAAPFLVYYALGGMMLVHAADAKDASESAFASLHRLIGHAESAGVTPRDASQVRFGDLDIAIESVEAIEFPLDEPYRRSSPLSPALGRTPRGHSTRCRSGTSRRDHKRRGG